jgi:transcriptional regulator with XRE-family HTH domain
MTELPMLAAFICRIRTQAGLSQSGLAALLGVRQSAVSQSERGITEPFGGHLFALLIKLAPTSTIMLAGYIAHHHQAAHHGPHAPKDPR